MPNYLKMPKQQHVIALLELGWSYRRIQGGDRGAPRDGRAIRPRSPGKSGQSVPRLTAGGTARYRGIAGRGRSKCGQSVRQLESKPGQSVPRLARQTIAI